MSSGWIFDFKRFAIHDGPGIRTTVFMKGCPLRCSWCHNPESQSPLPVCLKRERKIDGRVFHEEEWIGREMTAAEIMKEVMKDEVFYRESEGGVTLSGGEPLLQPDFLTEVLQLFKQRGVHTCIDTCGYAERRYFEQVLEYTDLFLYDLKIVDETEHQRHTGVSNRLVLENLEWLVTQDCEVVVRVPLVPGVTDRRENISAMVDLLAPMGLRRIDLIPYHRTAKGKYARLKMPYFEPAAVARPAEEIMEFFTTKGFETKIA